MVQLLHSLWAPANHFPLLWGQIFFYILVYLCCCWDVAEYGQQQGGWFSAGTEPGNPTPGSPRIASFWRGVLVRIYYELESDGISRADPIYNCAQNSTDPSENQPPNFLPTFKAEAWWSKDPEPTSFHLRRIWFGLAHTVTYWSL